MPASRISALQRERRTIVPGPKAWPSAEGVPALTKDAIFAYVYAVLHDPVYREKYALNLKREFPRIPFYTDFAKWAAWGQQLLNMHIGYEEAAPFALERTDTPKRTGVLACWQRSGNWPDFCREPDLPYDCMKEAAKIT